MASEDLFQNDYSEEPDFGQDLDKNEEMNTEAAAAESDGEDAEPAPAPNQTTNMSPPANKTSNGSKASEPEPDGKLTQLPMGRIRNIMKLDPDLQIASNEAVFAVTKAVELFIESLARESFTYTAQAKKKTVQKRDVELAISAVDSLIFLDGALHF
ncbi:DNA polymerase epsilon subunit 4 [Drosophila grimshawi]|uniref:GH21365 n=1 Tax=Drosophila grimshawi TaxID=7222 RepID=B4J8N2_DROGR|nr:DNA polymerase epsilon subunit 4 [Drosophila grimshawi]EDW01299.1 GH21365 [Drosophila grimshawi]